MIISTMTEAEIVAELDKDYLHAFRYSDHLDRKFRRRVIKSSRFPVRVHYKYISPRKNHWLLFFEARSKKEILDNSRITLVCIFDAPKGTYAAMGTLTGGKMHYVIYLPHFFSRYRSRFIQSDVNTKDLVVRFFTENYSYVYNINEIKLDNDAVMKEIHGSTKEGVALGYQSTEGNVLFKTFVTYEMLKGEQIAKFTENEKIRQEIHG